MGVLEGGGLGGVWRGGWGDLGVGLGGGGLGGNLGRGLVEGVLGLQPHLFLEGVLNTCQYCQPPNFGIENKINVHNLGIQLCTMLISMCISIESTIPFGVLVGVKVGGLA